ncbi:hypothetical protein CHLRE_17g715400v5 [Chlamydomonas reinhardtii]|uniref:Rab-GAP TBC domain-containing protein n=1 Tax=Chlamydomonas reinhardtii TaxID=3055 RepID=A0A2K3CPX9_CHLRE|nr:uncharacterized protein CHLRE_17g715400v5 [Chlamydomonas reinhardtii]PNW70328.1 hypothetical protein CHLRE_17g715400v5 [Chlamydomonas reinhardtii]
MARHKNRVLPLHRQLKPADRASAWNALLLDSPGNAAGCVIPCCLLVDKLASTEGEAAAVDYDRLGGTEPWEHTARRIAMDAERISHEGQVLRDASRPAGIKRLRRILTAYALMDCEVGYCQGMTDLLAPFLEVYADDQEAFTAFCGLMARVRANFLCGMEDMHRQLRLLGEVLGRLDGRLHRHLVAVGAGSFVFAFQMLLLQLRREVAWEDVFVLWETMWAREARLADALAPPLAAGSGAAVAEASQAQLPQPQQQVPPAQQLGAAAAAWAGADLRVFVVAAALRGQRTALLSCASLEEVVQFVNRFPRPTKVVALVEQAEYMFVKFRRLQRPSSGGGRSGSLSGCLRGGCSSGIEHTEQPAARSRPPPAQVPQGLVTTSESDSRGPS